MRAEWDQIPIEVRSAIDEALGSPVVEAVSFTSFQPPPPGLPTLRAFQREQAEVGRRWIGDRLGLD